MRVLPRHLNAQLILLVSLILLVTGVASGWLTAHRQSETLLATMRENSMVLTRNIAENAARYLVLQDFAGLESLLLKSAALPDITRLQACEPDGGVVGDVARAPGEKPRTVTILERLHPPSRPATAVTVAQGSLIIWEPIFAGSQLGWIRATSTMATIRRVQAESWRNTLLLSLLWVAGSAGMLVLVLRPTVQAVRRLSAFARRLDEHKGDQMEAAHRAIEVEELGLSLNYASSRLFTTEQQLIRERERLRVMLQSIRDGVIAADTDGTVIFMNPASEELTGWSAARAVGQEVDAVFRFCAPEADSPEQRRSLKNTASGSAVDFGADSLLLTADGRERPVAGSAAPILDDGGNPSGMVIVFRDITDFKQAERERLANLKFFKSMDLVNRAMQCARDADGMMSDVLEAVLAIFECDRALLLYPCDPEAPAWPVPVERVRPGCPAVRTFGRGFPTDAHVAATLSATLLADGPVQFAPGAGSPLFSDIAERFGVKSLLAMALHPKIGQPWQFSVHQCSHPRVWTPEEVKLLQEIGRRLSDSLTSLFAYRDLQKSEEFLDAIVENIPDMIFVKDASDLRFVRFNKAGELLLGYQRKDLLGKNDYDLFPREQADTFTAKDREVLDRKYLVDIAEETIKTREHGDRLLHTKKIPVLDMDGQPQYLLGIAEDITERTRAQAKLDEREAFIRNILEAVDEGFIVLDREYRILSANRAFCSLAQLPEDRVVGRPCYEISHHATRPCWAEGEACPVRRTFETGNAHGATHVHTDAAGATHHVELKSYPITDAAGQVVSVIETSSDVTEKSKLEEQLRQAQKMEAIGTLAGGVAHDFNNMLTAIIGYGSLVKLKMKPDDPLRSSMDQILSASDSAAHLTQGLLAFSRKQIINPVPVDVNKILANVEKLLRRLIGEDVELSTRLTEKPLIVRADAGQIEQVLMNLATNARDAMPGGGALTIGIEPLELDDAFVEAHGFSKRGKYALICVSDTGQGMDEPTLQKIFEPFFTTKELGKGTGLGLAIVYGIVKQHEGGITVASEKGKGTTFKIYLPLVAAAAEEASAAKTALPRGGTETILIAEDSAEVRNLTITILTDFGYRVIATADGQEAIEKFGAHAAEIDLVLVDVIMPKKNGREVFEAARAIRPGVKVVFTSGYTAELMHQRGVFDQSMPFLPKPVSPYVLLRKIREVLDQTPSGPA